MFGLCVVPCLYAWFNIFSNWDPYGKSATSRISVAVVSCDIGANILGLNINVGDKVIEALESNDSIGWVFVDSKDEAYELINSGDCYAGLILPEDFTTDVVSFIALDFEHPEIIYCENEKKNAIAPKITGKAKTAVQEQVNATFTETIISYIGEALKLLDINGVNYEGTVGNLSKTADNLVVKLEEIDGLLASLCTLLDATEQLMYNSGELSANVAETSYRTAHLAETLSKDSSALNTNITYTNNQLKQQLIEEDSTLSSVDAVLSDETATEEQKAAALEVLKNYTETHNNELSADLIKFMEEMNTSPQEAQKDLLLAVIECRRIILNNLYKTVIESSPHVENVLGYLAVSSENAADAMSDAGNASSQISQTFFSIMEPLNTLEANLYETRENLIQARQELSQLSDTLETLAGNEFLQDLSSTLLEEGDKLGSHFASPIKMKTFEMYPIENYGSAMAPFYTVLAQWVGALFCAALLKARVRKEHCPEGLTMPQEFFGRYALFATVGLIQALVTAFGDLYYIGIYCLHPGLFILAAVVTSLCFSMMNYALLFSLEKIGLGLSVIIMVIQVAGSGGSYPVDVVPKVFRSLYPFMPFNYAMNAMREAIAGTYSNYYQKYILILMLITLIFTGLGLVVYHPMHSLNKMIAESTKKSEIMT